MLCSSQDGSGVSGRLDTCVCLAESPCCAPETLAALLIGYAAAATAAAKSLQSCPTLCVRLPRRQPTRLPRPWDSPGKNTGVGCHFLLQCMKVKSLSHVWHFAIPRTAAYQAPPSMGFSRQEYWSGVPSPSPLQILVVFKCMLMSSW